MWRWGTLSIHFIECASPLWSRFLLTSPLSEQRLQGYFSLRASDQQQPPILPCITLAFNDGHRRSILLFVQVEQEATTFSLSQKVSVEASWGSSPPLPPSSKGGPTRGELPPQQRCGALFTHQRALCPRRLVNQRQVRSSFLT